jgi:hypothetical protein
MTGQPGGSHLVENPNPRTVARQLADTLGETYSGPRRKIAQIVQLCGVEFAQDILRQTYEVEVGGGMLTNKGDRQRTPGGVFLRLAKDQMDPKIRDRIFPFVTWQERKRRRKERQQKIAAQEVAKQDQRSRPGPTSASRVASTVVKLPPEAEAQIHQLQSAATVLREKLAAMEATGQRAGVEMTRRVLDKTERKIAALEEQYARMS